MESGEGRRCSEVTQACRDHAFQVLSYSSGIAEQSLSFQGWGQNSSFFWECHLLTQWLQHQCACGCCWLRPCKVFPDSRKLKEGQGDMYTCGIRLFAVFSWDGWSLLLKISTFFALFVDCFMAFLGGTRTLLFWLPDTYLCFCASPYILMFYFMSF